MADYLPLIFAGVVAFAVIMYVLLDGFDLGIGILFPWIPHKEHRAIMMNSVAPVWDGNETWMVLVAQFYTAHFRLHIARYYPCFICPSC